MKLFIFFALSTIAYAEIVYKKDLNLTNLRSIWESPKLKSVLDKSERKFHHGISSRIYGGENAEPGQFPFYIFLEIDYKYYCGAALIRAEWVLTAAHCVYGFRAVDIFSSVRLNENAYWKSGTELLLSHLKFDPDSQAYDIALIKTKTGPTDHENINVATEVEDKGNDYYAGYIATMMGFGKTMTSSDPLSLDLKFVSLPVLLDSECKKYWPQLSETHFCVFAPKDIGLCGNDYGGPLTLGVNIYSKVIGIASYGSSIGCGIDQPMVFTRVSTFYDWIREQLLFN